MRVRFWGTRGSIAKPGPSTLRYGGNTSCVEVVADDGTLVVIDCGTGAHELARQLLARPNAARRGHLLVSHTHWDHIQGFPFFDPLFLRGSEWDIYAPGGHARHLRSALAGQMSYDYHPVTLDAHEGTLRFHDLTEGHFQAGSIRITTQYLNHPALTLGYRLEADGVALVYASDHEPHVPLAAGPGPIVPTHLEDLRHVRFLEGADLVIHDAQYTRDDFPAKSGWGHSPAESAVDYAIAAGIHKLALHHHDPLRDDDAIDRVTEMAQRRAARASRAPEVFGAGEGMEIALVAQPARGPQREPDGRSALLPAEPTTPATVLLIGAQSEGWHDVRRALEAEPIRLLQVADVATALASAGARQPSLLILDHGSSGDGGVAECRAVRESGRFEEVPVLMLTDAVRESDDMALAFRAGASDYLVKPIKSTLLRARVRSWLLRSRST